MTILSRQLLIISTISMSEGSISDRQPQSYEDFAYRFQLAEGLPQDQKGVIFIGNTRAGKSTLALAMSGAAMKVVYDDGALTYLNPSDKNFKDIVRNTQQSVTEKPNFYPSRQGHNKWAIVDMPGHADSSRFRQLINFHYIRTMAANLKEVRFLLVVTLQHRNGRFLMPEKELQMLNSFQIMFPNCSNCVNIIINRVQEASVNAAPAAACFRDTVIHSNIPGLSKYYGSITNKNIFVIERPPYRKGPYGQEKHEAPYNTINSIMQDICNSNSQFMRLSEHSYYSLNVFKEGDNAKNKEFYLKLLEINHLIAQGVTAAVKIFQKTLLTLIQTVVQKGTCKLCEEQLINIFNIFLGKYTIDAPHKRSLTPLIFNGEILLQNSKVFQLLDFITSEDFKLKIEISKEESRKGLKLGEDYSRKITDNYCSKLLQIVESTFGKGELYGKVMDYYIFLDRRISESYFIANIVLEKEALGEGEEKQEAIGKVYTNFQSFIDILGESFISPFQSLVDTTVNFSVSALFKNYNPGQYDQLKGQIFDNFNLIEKMGQQAYKDKDKFSKVIRSKMKQKKNEINFFVIVNSEPSTPQQTVTHIEKLLKAYQETDLSMRIKLLHKLAKLLQAQKEIKHAIALNIHLNLNEEALRLLAVLTPTLKMEAIAQFYSEMAAAFEENAMFLYAQKCLESAKLNSLDELERFIQYERRILNLNDPKYTSKIVEKRLQAKDIKGYWNWANLDNEILFLKQKYRIKDQSPSKSVILKSYP